MAALVLSVAAGTAAASAYLNARLSLEHDALFFGIVGSTVFNVVRAVRADKINVFYVLEKKALDMATANTVFLWFEGCTHTYAETYDKVLRYGTWLRTKHNVKAKEIVALDYQNSDTFVFLWFALWSIGAKPAFINYNLTGKPLAHCLRAATTKLAIVDPRVAESLTDEVRGETQGIEFVVFTPEREAEAHVTEAVRCEDEVRSEEGFVGMAILIYTSGTTGLPKPAIVSWGKIYTAASLAGRGTGTKPGEIFYTCMPLFHSSASCLCVGNVLFAGATVAIGRRFSTKTFWKEVRASGATIILYVGETCRYLTVAPPELDPFTGENLDKKHSVRVAMGNGLRPDVWDRFKERFGIDTIFEFYAATEGALGTCNRSRNSFGKGAIGRFGFLSKTVVGIRSATVRLNYETELPWRDPKTGLCQRVKAGNPGEFIVKLPSDDVGKRFQGYYGNAAATNSKIMRDVFTKGDAWFRSGDIMQWDSEGRVFFNDRIGDTFRWKSENVSTAEVAQVLGLHPAVIEANVYGVQLPHHDGRAGCVAIVLGQSAVGEDLLASLAAHATQKLPRYAVPLFLRVGKEVGLQNTGTNKQQKQALRQQNIDPAKVQGDEMFWLKDGTYVPFGEKEWRELEGGRV
ncbi:hypothetical protein B0H63DRAFT_485581, partial [Podospora didyma]